jgi:hypothetical protein
MSQITLYSPEAPDLKLGPGTIDMQMTDPEDGGAPVDPGRAVIVFVQGFATFDPDDPEKPWLKDWRKWVNHPGTPYIEILDTTDELVPVGEGFDCPQCADTKAPRSFPTKKALAMHLYNHSKGRVKVPV